VHSVFLLFEWAEEVDGSVAVDVDGSVAVDMEVYLVVAEEGSFMVHKLAH
jgi:hypothetical protein